MRLTGVSNINTERQSSTADDSMLDNIDIDNQGYIDIDFDVGSIYNIGAAVLSGVCVIDRLG
jgi:hypothetical protein